jgi:hypothetical protein
MFFLQCTIELIAKEVNGMARIIAFIVLLIPALIAGAGIKFMRDTLYGNLISPFPWLWLQFLTGLIFSIIGIGFFAGYLLHRDRKRGRVAPRFQKNGDTKEMKQ